MRKMLPFIVALFMYCGSHAQFSKGDRFLGGNISFSTNGLSPQSGTGSDSRASNFGVLLGLSKFKSSSRYTGFSIAYSRNYQRAGTAPNENIMRSDGFSAYASTGKLQQIAKRLYLNFNGNVSAGYGFSSHRNKSSSLTSTSNSIGASVNGSLGIMYQLNERFLVTGGLTNLIGLSYNRGTSKTKNNGVVVAGSEAKYSSLGIYTGLSGFSLNSLSFGFSYLLRKL